MQESSICNAKLTKFDGHYLLNLKGEPGLYISIDITEKVANKLKNGLEIPIITYDSKHPGERQPHRKHAARRKKSNIRRLPNMQQTKKKA